MRTPLKHFLAALAALTAQALVLVPAVQAQGHQVYYTCPGNVFTNTISAKEAEQRGCKARETQPVTTVAMPRPKPAAAPSTSGKIGRAHV